MVAVQRQTTTPGFEPEPPGLDECVEYLWEMWRELNRARQAGGMSVNPLSYSEIEAFCRLTDVQLEPWEARALRAVDDAYMAGLAAGDSTGDG